VPIFYHGVWQTLRDSGRVKNPIYQIIVFRNCVYLFVYDCKNASVECHRESERWPVCVHKKEKKHAKRRFSKANVADQLQDCIQSNDCGRFASPLFKGEQRLKRSHTSKDHPGGTIKMRWLFVEFESEGFTRLHASKWREENKFIQFWFWLPSINHSRGTSPCWRRNLQMWRLPASYELSIKDLRY